MFTILSLIKFLATLSEIPHHLPFTPTWPLVLLSFHCCFLFFPLVSSLYNFKSSLMYFSYTIHQESCWLSLWYIPRIYSLHCYHPAPTSMYYSYILTCFIVSILPPSPPQHCILSRDFFKMHVGSCPSFVHNHPKFPHFIQSKAKIQIMEYMFFPQFEAYFSSFWQHLSPSTDIVLAFTYWLSIIYCLCTHMEAGVFLYFVHWYITLKNLE